MATRIVIAGISTRAAAESAAKAGFDVTAIDAFADLDQHPSVRAMAIPRPFSADAAARAAQTVGAQAAVYLSNFENHPDAVDVLTAGRALWGNAPDVLRRVRDPACLARALRHRGIQTPEVQVRLEPDLEQVRLKPDSTGRDWLVKPLASGGGHSIRRWTHGEAIPAGCYLQELISGTPGSMVIVAGARQVVLLGVTRQLIGDAAFGATGYHYCGSILVSRGAPDSIVTGARAAARAVVEAFDLAGVNGVDFVVHQGSIFVIEVNPRWTASVELAERAYGLSAFASHAAACARGALPDFDLTQTVRRGDAVGKAIVFARNDVTVGDTQKWIGDDSIRDVPHPGELIHAGRPVSQTLPGRPSPAGKTVWRLQVANSLSFSDGECQTSTQRSILAVWSTVQSAPTSH